MSEQVEETVPHDDNINRLKRKFYDIRYMNKSAEIRQRSLVWPDIDQTCFNIIFHDWIANYEKFISASKEHKVVVQAGGNCGLYPFLYSNYFDRVFTFEPDKDNFVVLSENCDLDNIYKFNAGLSYKTEFLRFSKVAPGNVGMHKVTDNGETEIFTMTIDSLDLPECSLIHLDIEEHEYFALLGAKKTLTKHRPAVIIEFTKHEKEIESFFEELNYKLVDEFGDPKNRIYQPAD